MNKKIICLILLSSFLTLLSGQIPQSISYQGIAIDKEGKVIKNSDVSVLIQFRGTSFSEEHFVRTTELGHVNLEIGRGLPNDGQFNDVDFESGDMYMRISFDLNGGTEYLPYGVVPFLSVPFAMVAEQSYSGTKGPFGPQGPFGLSGPQGPAGQQGLPGITGIALPGIQGEQGDQGPRGDEGPKGIKGLSLQGLKGEQGPRGPKGIKGDTNGPQGPKGLKGEDGDVGDTGEIGDKGPVGQKGPDGEPGGVPGPRGPKGDTGTDEGAQGVQGARGDKGDTGDSGRIGAQGSPGDNGIINMLMRNSPPTNGDLLYLDDGNNRSDGRPGFMYLVNGSWVDL